MVKIHYSFDKKTLVNIITQLNIDIDVSITRHNICKELIKYLSEYNLHYLTEQNKSIKLSIAEKQLIVIIGKQVSAYSLSVNKDEIFKTKDEFIKNIETILPHGDIPSIRKAIYRSNYNLGTNYKCSMSPQTTTILNRQKIIKSYKNNDGLSIKKGSFVISFT